MDEPRTPPSASSDQPPSGPAPQASPSEQRHPETQASLPTPKPPHDHNDHRKGFPFGRFIVGLIVILIGLSMLASTMGWTWFQNVEWWRLWPVLIILVGLSFLTGSRGAGRAVGILFTILLVAFIIAFFAGGFGAWRGDAEVVTGDVAVARDAAATAAELKLSTGVSRVSLKGGAADVVLGDYTSPFGKYTTSTALSGTTQQVTVAQNVQGRNWFWFGSRKSTLDLAVSNDLPLTLNLDGGAATFDLDLRTVQLIEADLDVGASTINLKLGGTVTKSTVNIDAGASTITITLPESVGARIDLDVGVTSKTLPRFSEKSDDVFETENYATAEKTVDLDLNLGASTVRVEWE